MKLSFFCLFLLLFVLSTNLNAQIYPRTDTLFIPETTTTPEINGENNDIQWGLANWNYIDQIWMPYANSPANVSGGLELWEDSLDFKGKYKVLWSSETNLLYFLVLTTDDIFTGDYEYNENPSLGGAYPNYDIVEVFIDEDRSGGLHVFDGTGNTGISWGTEAENAFSYHITVPEPEDGVVEKAFYALDIAGTNWSYPNQKIANYASHFNEFAVKKTATKYTWEFSLKIYNDSYNSANPEISMVTLEGEKILGLSLAYCDNDSPLESPLTRDHFFGSVFVPEAAYNDHWMQANWFGVAKLKEGNSTSSNKTISSESVKFDSYISNRHLYNEVISPANGKISIRILNMVGVPVYTFTGEKFSNKWNNRIEINNIPAGIYITELIFSNQKATKKIVVN
ncbi:MAG: sugar-binding protein [Draconibacterium sp.]